MRLVILGYGNVGREWGALLAEKTATLRATYHLTPRIVGVMTGRHGGWISEAPEGIAAQVVAEAGWPTSPDVPVGAVAFPGSALDLINAVEADALIEITPTDPRTGEPALSHVRAAFAKGMHVVTANKGPIALAYRALLAEAEQRGVQLRFESTVIDGTPIINLAEFTLPATEIQGVRAIINGTSNFILSGMFLGQSFADALAQAQQIGMAEADPSLDLDGWDAAVKLTIIANVLMGADIRPSDVIRESSAERMQELAANAPPGSVAKQVATITRTPDGIQARVALEILPADDALAGIGQGKAAIQFQTDTMGDLTIIEGPGTPRQTAFGILADLITISRNK
jgi:homoserine dehydrogenase